MTYLSHKYIAAYLLLVSIATLGLGVAFIKYIDPLQETPAILIGQEPVLYEGISGRGLIDDEIQYLGISKSLATGSGYGWDAVHPSAVRVPGYPFYVATLFRLFGSTVAVALFGNAILVSLLPLLAYGMAKSAFGQGTGCVAALFCFFNPGIYHLGLSRAYSEPLFAVLLCAAILAWQEARKSVDLPKSVSLQRLSGLTGRTRRPLVFAVIAGLVYGIAGLTRTGYFGLMVVGVIVEAALSHTLNKVKVAIIISIVSLVTLIPWGVRNRLVLGTTVFSSTNDGITLLGATLAAQRGSGSWLNPSGVSPEYARIQRMPDGIERNRMARQAALSQLKTISIHHLVEVAIKRVLRLWVPLSRIIDDEVSTRANLVVNVWYFGFMLLAGIGLIKTWRDARVVPFLALFLYMTALAAVSWGSTRFRYGAEPILAALAGYGFLQASAWLRPATHSSNLQTHI